MKKNRRFVEVMERVSLVFFFVWGKSGCLLFFFEEKTVPAERLLLVVQSDFDVKIRWKSAFINDD